MTWTPRHIENLRELWANGLSCAQIARALGDGISRSAVIGKANRLNLPQRAPTPARQHKKNSEPKFGPVKKLPAPPRDEPRPLGVNGESLARGLCQWIHGDPCNIAWRMCGHPATGSYCPFHHQRSHPPKAKDDAA